MRLKMRVIVTLMDNVLLIFLDKMILAKNDTGNIKQGC